jgi:hypothetical protein
MSKRGWIALATGGVLLAFAAPAGAQTATQALVNVGSQDPTTPFPQNKQNEPAIAADPNNPGVLAAGANEEIDEPICGGPAGNECPFAQGIGTSGVYFSFNGGTSWTQPTYPGYSGRNGTGFGTSGCDGCQTSAEGGLIGTLPHYDTAGLVSDGDPGVAFGPSPDAHGNFSWNNGSRLYYSNLTSNFSTVRSDQTFKGFEAIAVSHADNVRAAANDDASAWSGPTVVTQQQSQTTFSDKPDITADNAATSPFFGNVYVCYSQFKSQQVNGPEPIQVSRSTDGGVHFSNPQSLTASHNGGNAGQGNNGRQGCNIRTDSLGNVYVVWEDTVQHQSVISLATSTDGGAHYSQPQVIADVTDVGIFDGVRSISFDGIAGARTSSFPSLSIANGAPSGANAPNTIAVGWSNGVLNQEHALVILSADGGSNWTSPAEVEDQSVTPADRPDFAFLGISPNGHDLYVTYDGFRDPFRNDTTSDRRFVGVVRHADVSGTSLSNLSTLDRGAVGDGRASSANALIDEFIGDYNSVAATNTGAVAVYNDARNAAVCTKINEFRQATVNGTAGAAPAPATDCPPDRGRVFGNTDIYSAAAADPTTP